MKNQNLTAAFTVNQTACLIGERRGCHHGSLPASVEHDQTIIKAQQDMLSRKQPEHPVLLEIDVGPVRYKRVLESLIEQEQQAAALPGGEGRAA